MADDQLDDGALCTLTQVLTSLGLSTVSALRRRQLIDAINEASAQAVAYCGRQGVGGFHFVPAYVEAVPGYNTPTITVQRYPIKVISVVGVDGGAVDVASLIVDGSAGIIRRRTGAWGSTATQSYGLTGDARRGSEQPTIVVTADSGWITDAQVAAGIASKATIPADLRGAIVRLAVSAWRNRGQVRDARVVSESLQSHSVAYDVSASGIPPEIAGVLDRYATTAHGG